ncbi:HAD-IIB family hydrolase [Chitinophaga solisilvae]|uniref:HAD-IIB family hydrolase n=1 Tax=Chitinophaga solisilvae TaxID=1233460 RepID=UPI001370563A|nr:HAD-IIB family hydrolase [Chitinophaga solisilvae]
MKQLMVFDLDGTLAQSKSAVDEEMAPLLAALLSVMQVAIISGGSWPQFEKQVLHYLPAAAPLHRLSILPTCGTQFYQYDNGWKQRYAENFTPAEKKTIIAALQQAVAETGFTPEKTWGEQIEDRGSQITWSALGQEAPPEEKKTWDPGFSKRKQIRQILDTLLSAYAVNLGGMTSVDITRSGIDKAYGIRKLRDTLGISIEEMLFVGDALFEGGNDYPAKQAGVACIAVRDPEETKRVVETAIAFLK